MGPCHLARSGRRPAPDQGATRDRVMRSPKRPEQPRCAVLAAGARDSGHLDHLVAAQRGQERGQALQGERLAAAGRPDQEQAVGSGGGDLQAAAQGGMTAQVREVGSEVSGWSGRLRRRDAARSRPLASSRSRVTWSTGITSSPPTRAAWAASPGATATPRMPHLHAASAIARAPGTGRIPPSRASSPASTYRSTHPARELPRGREERGGDRQIEARARPCAGRPARG